MISRDEFLRCVNAWVLDHPGDAPAIVYACELGIHEAINRMAEKNADIEAALAEALTPSKRKNITFIKEKLSRWSGKTALRWDWFLNP